MTYLAKEENNPPKTSAYLAKIDTSSKFLLSLVNDILDMSKAESNKIELHPEPYPSTVFVSYIDSVIRPLCDEKRQKLFFDIQPLPGYQPLMDIMPIFSFSSRVRKICWRVSSPSAMNTFR